MNSLKARRARALVQSVAFLTLSVSTVHAAQYSWDGASTGGDWNTPVNWSDDSVPDTSSESALFPAATSGARAVTLSSAITVSGITFENQSSGNATNLINPGVANTVTLDSGVVGTPVTISATGMYGGSIASGSNIHSIQTKLVLNSDLIFDVAPRTADYSGIVLSIRGSAASDISGNFSVTKTGLGTLVFADTFKTFGGPLVVNQGRIRFNTSGGMSGASSVTVNPGGQLNFEQGAVGTTNTNITLGGSNAIVNLSGLGTVQPSSAANGGSYNPGAIRAGGGVLQGGFTHTLTNSVNITGDTAINVLNNVNFNLNSVTNLGTLTLAGPVSGSGKLIAQELAGSPLSGGTLTLTRASTYTGGTTVNLGVLLVSNANLGVASLGTGDVFVDGNTERYTSSSVFPTLASGRLQIQGGVVNAIADTAALSLTGDTATYQGNGDTVVGGITILDDTVNETVSGLVLGGHLENGILVGGETKTVAGTYGGPASSAMFKSSYFSGTGVVTLAFNRTLYWDINKEAAGAGGAAPSGNWNGLTSNFNANSTGGAGLTVTPTTLSTDPVSFTAGSDGSGTYTVNVSGTQSAASVTVARGNVTLAGGTINTGAFNVATGATGTVSSSITGGSGASLTKLGNGTLTVANSNSFANGAVVNAGTVVAGHENALGTGSLTINNTATVRGQAGLAKALDYSSLSIAGGATPTGTLDLTDGALVVRNATLSTHTLINEQVEHAFNGFLWDQAGITSSTVKTAVENGEPRTLGILFNNDTGGNALFYGDGGDLPLFEGRSVDANTVLVKETFLGDGDLNGTVDSVDFALFQAGFDNSAPYIGFAFGDYNYDGFVDSVDFGLFQAGFDASQPLTQPTLAAAIAEFASANGLSLGATAVPEPASLGVLGLAACGLLARRRRA